MKKPTGQLSAKQLQAVPFFVTSHSVVEGCKLAGISVQTYYDWCKDAAFKAELEKARDELRQTTFSILRANLPIAALTLVELLKSPNDAVRRLAARDMIDLTVQNIEMTKFDERLKELEGKN
jgi:hypothetical protein